MRRAVAAVSRSSRLVASKVREGLLHVTIAVTRAEVRSPLSLCSGLALLKVWSEWDHDVTVDGPSALPIKRGGLSSSLTEAQV